MTALEGKALLDHGKAIAKRYAGRVGPDLAEELAAEAVARALHRPAPDGRIEPWLERIYRNLVVDVWRRHHGAGDHRALAELADERTPERAVLHQERRRVVRASLGSLPRDARRAILSRYYSDADDGVTAARFGVSPATVRTRIHRALCRLRARVAGLRVWLPPGLDRIAAQAASVGAAPVMVATLVIAGFAAPTVEPAMPVPLPHATHVATPARPPAAIASAPSPPAVPAAPAHTAKQLSVRVIAVRGEAVATARAPDESPAASAILQPDAIDVFAEPERPAPPCLVEPPPHFLAQIDEMLEDLL